jgi:hypothetical protein
MATRLIVADCYYVQVNMVKWATLFRANPVILLLQVNSLTLNNPQYILSHLWKASRSAQMKEKIQILVW